MEFVDELRRAGYNLSLDQYAAAQDLVLGLTARGEPLGPAEHFRDLLGPILCSSPKEQAEFAERFKRWVERPRLPAPPPVDFGFFTGFHKPEGGLADVVKGLSLRGLLWTVGIGIVLSVLLSSLIFLTLWFQSEEIFIPQGVGWSVVGTAGLIVLLIALIVAYQLWGRRRAELFLVRRQVTDEGISLQPLAVRDLSRRLFQSVSLYRIAQNLRRRREIPSPDLDIAATVGATVSRGGWLTPVHALRQITPEYLVLIDRVGYSDQQARLVDELISRLAEQGVFFNRYYFQGDPRICFPREEGGTPVRLRDLASLYPFHRLILFTDAAGLFSPRTGALAPWVDQFTAWEQRSLMTPEVPEQWGAPEGDLTRFFTVLPATIEGFAALARRTQAGVPLPRPAHRPIAPFPRELRDRALHWVDRSSPEPAEIDALLSSLRRFLGEAGFFWLAATAVYPALDWGLTLYLGDGLQMDGAPLLDPGRLRSLVRTPWLRHGFMPDWLREKLLSQLSPDQERSVRMAVEELLVTSLDKPADAFQLEIAQEDRRTLRSLGRQILRLRSRETPEDSPLRDRVFLSFMAGATQDPLALRLPRALRGLFSGWGARRSRPTGAAWRSKATVESGPDRPGNPWENRAQVGIVRGYLKTLMLFGLRPLTAYKLTRRREDLLSPLLFVAILSVATFALSLISSQIFGLSGTMLGGISSLIILTFWLIALHLSLMVTRSLKNSVAGFRGSVRVVAYASVAQLWELLPVTCLSSLIMLLWLGLLTLLGVKEIHGLSWRRSTLVITAALSPLWLLFLYVYMFMTSL